jgi:ABC-type transporter Mla MlaB component
MKTDRVNRQNKGVTTSQSNSPLPAPEEDIEPVSIEVERSGEWMPAEELRDAAVELLSEGKDIAVNLDRIDHLDASALQILLALEAEQNKQGRKLELVKASPHLRSWFEFAGADDHFFQERAEER